MRNCISIFIVILLPLLLLSQTQDKEAGRSCGVEQHMDQLLSDPVYAKEYKAKQKRFRDYTITNANKRQVCSNPVQIPVAIHYQDIGNPDVACLISLAEAQVQILNDDFQGQNSDISIWNNNASSFFPGVNNGEACIEFCIANQNHPSGYGLNNGDLAITINQTSGDFDPNWSGYLNFYVFDLQPPFQNALGYSPLGGQGNGDGVALNLFGFGDGGGCPGVVPNPPYNLGRTVTHELGHYLNLDHIWGGGCGNDDGIGDTPNSQDSYFGCPVIGVSTCGTTDMHMNYMDYVNDVCMYMFSDGQAGVMENYVSSNLGNLTSNASNVCGTGVFPVNTFLLDWKDPTCFGLSDGFIVVEADGGDGNFTFTLNGTITNSTGEFLNLPAGNYTIEVEDGNGTMGDPIDITLFDLDPLSIVIEQQENISCFGYGDGEIEVDAVGGAGNYTYSVNGGSFTPSGLFTELPADTYVITVNDENGCESVTSQIILTEPDPFTIALDSLLAPECGEANGILIAEGIGGESLAGEYTYILDSLTFDTLMIGGVLVDTIYHDTIAIISTDTLGAFENLYAGIYNISAVDINGCATVLEELELSEADAIQITVLDSYLNLVCAEDDNGLIGIEGSNTEGPYMYSDDGVNFTELGLFNNLSEGSYEFFVMDNAGCVNSIAVEVTAPPQLELTLEETMPLLCHNGMDAQITLSATGGTGDLTFYQNDDSNPIPNVVNNLGTGIWTFIVQDENDCAVEIDYFITEPDAINILIDDIVEVECFGDETGEAQVSAEGGMGDITFTLGTETNSSGFFTGLTSGSYTVIATDENQCTSEELFEIEQTSDLQLNIDIIDEVACHGDSNGSFSLKGEGGTGDYTYSLDGINFTSQDEYFGYAGGLYNVFVADGNDCITIGVVEMDDPELLEMEINQLEFLECNGETTAFVRVDAIGGTGEYTFSNGITTNSDGFFMNQAGGTYIFSVVDENECLTSMEFIIEEPSPIELAITNTENNSCDGKMVGSISAAANGGTGILTYNISGQGTNTTGLFENLPAGNYTVLVRDENNCTTTQDVSIINTIDVNLTLIDQTNPNCFGANNGVIEVAVSGSGGGDEFTIGSTTNTTGIFTGLIADNYVVEVIDAAGCNASIDVTLDQPSDLTITSMDITPVTCFGLEDGTVLLSASGGTGVISYTVNGETNTTGLFTNLGSQVYTYVLEDENGCIQSTNDNQFTIDQPDEIEMNTSLFAPVRCFGDMTGEILVTAVGGSGNFSYSINNQENSETGFFVNLPAGTYSISAIDDNGCLQQEDYTIEQPTQLITEITEQTNVLCNGESSGSIRFNSSGGTPDYTYTLNDIQSSVPGYINLPADTYIVTISDQVGCSEELQFVISEPDAFTIEASTTADNGETNGTIQLNMLGGLAPYSVVESGSASFDASNFAQNLSSGFYTIDVRDANGCIQSIEVEVLFNDKLDNVLDGTTIEHVLYPVPSNVDLNLTLLSPNEQDLYFYILDATGKFIYDQDAVAIRGENAYNFSLEDFASGNYVLGLISDRQNLHFKFQVVD